MNKKIILTCALFIALALIITGCRLPASGSPPTVGPTSPAIATSTSGSVQAEPTATNAIPPTVAVPTNTEQPPTAVPPTAEPPTAEPPTAVPPTPAPLPQASRIQFVVGGTSATVNGDVDSGQTVYYVLGASGGQTMNLKVQSPNGDVYLGVFVANQILLDPSSQDTVWSGTLPSTQDYYISLTAGDGKSSYTLSVEIPPLSGGPTANVTPVPGAFDPIATYGSATFSDPMTGENIRDWVNPSTGLLPDTKYIKLTESNQMFYVTGKIAGWTTWYFQWRELDDFYQETVFDSGACAGKDAYGMIVRGPVHQAGVSYGYVVSFSCDGQFYVYRLDSANPFTVKDLVSWTHSDYIAAGANKQNFMGIKFIGNKLTIYANGNQIAEVTDDKFNAGRYGVYVSPEKTANYTYRVVNMSYWDLTP